MEDYVDMLSDTPFMLFGMPDTAAFTAAKPLEVAPDSRWRYISGSPNLVCRIMRRAIGGSLAQYFAFPRRALFDKIGMRSAVIEPDAAGTFVGSSFSYATARDWAKFGLLYLRDGVWMTDGCSRKDGSNMRPPRLLKRLKGSMAPLVVECGKSFGSANRLYPSLPTDLYAALGYEGQNVVVIPSRDLVVVHLGAANPPEGTWNPEELVGEVLKAVKQP